MQYLPVVRVRDSIVAPQRWSHRVVAADDLSGACEIAGLLHQHGTRSIVELLGRPPGEEQPPTGPRTGRVVRIIDLDVRSSTNEEAARRLSRLDLDAIDYVKVDSMLRGPITGLIDAITAGGRRAAFCPALPAAGRTVAHDVPLLDGLPLGETTAWQLENEPPPSSLAGVLAPVARTTNLRPAGSGSDVDVITADASSDADLDQLAERVDAEERLAVGSAGLFAALLRRRPAVSAPTATTDRRGCSRAPVLIVVGTASPQAREQVDHLAGLGASVIDLDPSGSDASVATPDHLGEGERLVLRWAPSDHLEPGLAPDLDRRLIELATSIAVRSAATRLVLTGGTTARLTLDALGASALRVLRVVHHGGAVLETDGGRIVAIRPGSFGDYRSLEHLADEAVSSVSEGTPWN